MGRLLFKPHRALSPLAAFYRWATHFRNQRFDRGSINAYQADCPVISVGNITAGGTGKSPIASFIMRHLSESGRSPVLLSRGYKGSAVGPHLVQASDIAELVGDEALMHYRRLSGASNVVVSRDRSAGCRFITSKGVGDVVVLDDGFQHRRLKRDLDIVLIDVSNSAAVQEWKDGTMLPAGSFREDKDRALSRADCVLAVTRNAEFVESLGNLRAALGIDSSIPTFTVVLYPECFIDSRTLYRFELDELKVASVRAVTGIAKPDDFFTMLKGLGLNIDGTFSYPDHHRYSENDWREVCSGYAGPLITTAKDAVKLEKFPDHCAGVYVLQLGVKFICMGEERRFWNMVESSISAKEDAATSKQDTDKEALEEIQ